MSDGVQLNSGAGGAILATDEVLRGGTLMQHQIVKPVFGGDGVATEVTAAAPLPVTDAGIVALLPPVGLTMHRRVSAGLDDLVLVAAGALKLYGGMLSSVNAAMRYLHFFDKASAPVLATDGGSLKATIPIPGLAAGTATPFSIPGGLTFTLGIAYAITTVIGGTTGAATASEHVVNLWYK